MPEEKLNQDKGLMEIAVTPEMIEAGVVVLLEELGDDATIIPGVDEIVAEIYRKMATVASWTECLRAKP